MLAGAMYLNHQANERNSGNLMIKMLVSYNKNMIVIYRTLSDNVK